MARERFTEELKLAAVRQITDGRYSASGVSKQLNVTVDS